MRSSRFASSLTPILMPFRRDSKSTRTRLVTEPTRFSSTLTSKRCPRQVARNFVSGSSTPRSWFARLALARRSRLLILPHRRSPISNGWEGWESLRACSLPTVSEFERLSVRPTKRRVRAATSDRSYAEARIGPERIKGAYAWASLIKCVRSRRSPRHQLVLIVRRNGSRIALGSDFPVESVDPMKGIHAAVYREGW